MDIKVNSAVKRYAFTRDDLLQILAEALDNAIENACYGSEIQVNIEQKGDFMQLSICNCVEQEVVIKGNRIQTTKADKEHHGYGLGGIRAIVRKYQGDVQFICHDHQFTCLILASYGMEG